MFSQQFQYSSDRLLLRRAIIMWNDVLYKSFVAWAQITRDESRCHLLSMRMLYWRVQQIIKVWRYRVDMTAKLKLFFISICNIHALHKQRRCFKRWNLMRKIHNACRITSSDFKTKALALTKIRIGRLDMTKKQMFCIWRDETDFELKLMVAFRWHCKTLMKDTFFRWRNNSIKMQLKRKEDEHKLWVIGTIESIHTSKQDDEKTNHKYEETSKGTKPKSAKVEQARAAITAEYDKNVLSQQQHARRKRYEQEKNTLAKNWELKWNSIEKDRVEKSMRSIRKWLSSNHGQNDLLKQLKRIELDLKSPSHRLAESKLIALALLDGKLAQKNILAVTFVKNLHKYTNKLGMIQKDAFVYYLRSLGIQMTPSLVRDIFYDVEYRDKANKSIPLSHMEEMMKTTYEYFGTQGSRYKMYISQCHDMVTFHDTYTNEVSMDKSQF